MANPADSLESVNTILTVISSLQQTQTILPGLNNTSTPTATNYNSNTQNEYNREYAFY
jgi:hypothetical protein